MLTSSGRNTALSKRLFLTVVQGHELSEYAKRASQWGAFFIALMFLWLLPGLPAQAQSCVADRFDEQPGVSQVVDGDTLRLEDGRLLRFIGINTPEIGRDGNPSEAFAEQARDVLLGLLGPNPRVSLRYDHERQDRYGRLLAHVYLADGRSLGRQLLEQGFAAHIVVPPNDWNADCYRKAELAARESAKGVWSTLYRPIPVNELPRSTRGFRVIRGRVEYVAESRRSLWLNFPHLPGEGDRGGVALRVNRDELANFTDWQPYELQGKEVEVRGWLYPSGEQLLMSVRHPAALRILSP